VSLFTKTSNKNKQKFKPNSNKGINLGFNEKVNSYIFMDFEDFLKSIMSGKSTAKEDEPANISIVNKGSNSDLYPSFFRIQFYFNKS